MPSYHFPIILGQNEKERIVIIHLTDGTEDYQENRVVVVSSSENDPLFRIPKEAKMVKSDGSNADNVAITRGNLTIRDGSTNRRIVTHEKDDFYEYTIKNNVDYGFDGIIKFRFKNKINNTEYEGSLNIIRTEDSNVLKINIDLGSEATQATCFCQNIAAGQCQQINLVEAIKKTYTKRDYDGLTNPTSETLFTQQDEDNPYYYKTGNITFHKYSNNSSYGDLTLNEVHDTDHEETNGKTTFRPFVNYLNVAAAGKNANSSMSGVWDKEIPYTEKLFNIKVLYANTGGVGPMCHVQWRNHKDLRVHPVNQPGDITRVLRVIYKQIITATEKGFIQFYDDDNNANNIKATSVLVLVPNIYKQEDIDELLYNLNKLNNSAINNQANGNMRYDFRVISESDAAFLGVKEVGINGNETILNRINREVDDERRKDAYLIIDSGKGTTDFSIINYNPGGTNSVSSYKRGGIAGAGGAIDYVFTRIVARQIYENSSKNPKCDKTVFVNRFMEVISKLHPTRQDKAMRLIESAKKNYDVENGTIPTVCNCFPNAIIDQMMAESATIDIENDIISSKMDGEWNKFENNDWDNTSCTPVEEIDKSEIAKVCNMIAEETIKKIFGDTDKHITHRIDVVLMTGRSFLFEPLRLAFEKMLNEKKGIFNVNFSGFWAPIVNVIWYRPAYNKMKKGKQTRINKEKLAERANLKIDDTTLSLNMKEVSVKFSERDLGYNCNSDLCCLDSLKLINDDMEFDFKQDMFWNGFTYNDGSEDYYIGYKGKSFACHDRIQIVGGNITDLEKMTLFPNHYEPDVNL